MGFVKKFSTRGGVVERVFKLSRGSGLAQNPRSIQCICRNFLSMTGYYLINEPFHR